MAKRKPKVAEPAKEETIKMTRRHTEYQEVDVDASMGVAGPDYSGENPEKPGSARWLSWENHRREAMGLPATNDPTDTTEPVKMRQRHGAYQEVDYAASRYVPTSYKA